MLRASLVTALLFVGACTQEDLARRCEGPSCPPTISLEPGPRPTLLISDRQEDGVLAVDAETGESLGWFVKLGTRGVGRPSVLEPHGDQGLLANFGDGKILRVDGLTGELLGTLFHDRTVLEEPVAITFGDDEQILVLGNDTYNVVVLDAEGALLSSFGNPIMRSPHDMVFGDDGLLYVAVAQDAGGVQVWDATTGEMVRALSSTSILSEATALAFDDAGHLLVADAIAGSIHRFAKSGDYLGELAISETLSRPLSMTRRGSTLFVLDDRGIVRADLATDSVVSRYEFDELFAPRSLRVHLW